jgi:hypothetical protein
MYITVLLQDYGAYLDTIYCSCVKQHEPLYVIRRVTAITVSVLDAVILQL